MSTSDSAFFIDINTSFVLAIDIQEKLTKVMPEIDQLYQKAKLVLKCAGELGVPIYLTEQYPDGLGKTVPEIKDQIDNLAGFAAKKSFSCFAEAHLEDMFAQVMVDRPTVVLLGIESHVCVLQTALDFIAQGRRVVVVKDAIMSRNPEDHKSALDRMTRAGVVLVSAEMLFFEWLRSADHPKFKALSKMVQ